MLNKIILSVLISQSLVLARDCQYYGAQAAYYQKKVNTIASVKPMDWCAAADALEQAVNNLDTETKVCIGGEALRPTVKQYMGYLAQATIKCGH